MERKEIVRIRHLNVRSRYQFLIPMIIMQLLQFFAVSVVKALAKVRVRLTSLQKHSVVKGNFLSDRFRLMSDLLFHFFDSFNKFISLIRLSEQGNRLRFVYNWTTHFTKGFTSTQTGGF